MRSYQKIMGLGLLGGAFMVGSVACSSEQGESSLQGGASSEAVLTFMTGETYFSLPDQACRQHSDSYLCIQLSHWEEDPANIIRAQVCKYAIQEDGVIVKNVKFDNYPLRWRVRLAKKQVTDDFIYTPIDEWETCTNFLKVDLKNLPCDGLSIISAEVLSPDTCTGQECTYSTGGLSVGRNCPPQGPHP